MPCDASSTEYRRTTSSCCHPTGAGAEVEAGRSRRLVRAVLRGLRLPEVATRIPWHRRHEVARLLRFFEVATRVRLPRRRREREVVLLGGVNGPIGIIPAVEVDHGAHLEIKSAERQTEVAFLRRVSIVAGTGRVALIPGMVSAGE